MKLKMSDGEIITVVYMGPEEVEVKGALVTKTLTKTVVYGFTKNDMKPKRYLMEEAALVEK